MSNRTEPFALSLSTGQRGARGGCDKLSPHGSSVERGPLP